MNRSNFSRPKLRPRSMIVLAGGLIGALLATSAVAVAGGPNSGTAKICQKGGWASPNLQTNSGQSVAFASQDACVAYGARVGPLFNPSLTATPGHVIENVESFLTAAGFHPSSLGTLTIQNLGGPGGSVGLPATTTATGGLPDGVGTLFEPGACALGITGAEVTLVDGSGVHASTTVSLDCP